MQKLASILYKSGLMEDDDIKDILDVERSSDDVADEDESDPHGKLTTRDLGRLAEEIEMEKLEAKATECFGFSRVAVKNIKGDVHGYSFAFNLFILDKWKKKTSGNRQVLLFLNQDNFPNLFHFYYSGSKTK